MIFLPTRSVLRIAGADRKGFLQGLITNDVNRLSPTHPLYAVMLSPQGKVLFDFIFTEQSEEIWLDCWREKVADLVQKLTMYKLRAKVTIAWDESLQVYAGLGIQDSGFRDPRHPELGARLITAEALPAGNFSDYDLHRLSLGIPDSADFIPDRSFAMEFGIADLHGISYTKGCYVGQEIVARSKTRGVLNKALYKVTAETNLPAIDTPIMRGETEMGTLRSSAGNIGLAILRIDEVAKAEPLTAAGISLTAQLPDWFSLPTPAINAP
jgi:folate-binding protein YgfZ